MSDLHDAALAAGVFSYIETRAKALKDGARDRLKALPFGDGVSGKTPDGKIVCKAAWVKGRSKVVVTDERALLAWVKEHHPSEIIETVNPAFLKTFGVVEGQVHWQGEPVDFMESQESEPYVTVRNDKEAPFLIAQLISQGAIGFDGPLAIEGEQ